MEAIEPKDLTRRYSTTTGIIKQKRKEVTALDGINLNIERGELFGMLGPNGAGKTTLTKILATILLPSSGSVKILGKDVARDVKAPRPQIGILFGGERGLTRSTASRIWRSVA